MKEPGKLENWCSQWIAEVFQNMAIFINRVSNNSKLNPFHGDKLFRVFVQLTVKILCTI